MHLESFPHGLLICSLSSVADHNRAATTRRGFTSFPSDYGMFSWNDTLLNYSPVTEVGER